MKGEGMELLCDFFKKNKNKKYKELKLIGCNLNDDDFSVYSIKCIFEIIKKIKGLKSIFLYNNKFSKGFKEKIKNYDKDNSLYNVRLYV